MGVLGNLRMGLVRADIARTETGSSQSARWVDFIMIFGIGVPNPGPKSVTPPVVAQNMASAGGVSHSRTFGAGHVQISPGSTSAGSFLKPTCFWRPSFFTLSRS